MKRVLVTGSAGFAGSHLVEHLLENTDWEIVGLDSLKHRGDSLRIDTYKDPEEHKRYGFYVHDLRTPISYRLIRLIGKIDYVVNLASESHVDRSIEDPVNFVENNVSLALNMLQYAREVKPEIFIQFSTDEVYGAALSGQNHVEWSTILPSNPYAGSKAAQEAIAISFWRTYGVRLILTNTMNLFGERQDPEKFIPKIIHKVMNDEVMDIHGKIVDGKEFYGMRHYIHCRNMADAILFLLKKGQVTDYYDSDSLIVPDRWNIVGDVEVDNLQMAQKIASICGKELKYQIIDFHSARPGHDRRYALDGIKLKNAGWNAPMSFDVSLQKAVEWTLNSKIWKP